jgi:hypothetical protein
MPKLIIRDGKAIEVATKDELRALAAAADTVPVQRLPPGRPSKALSGWARRRLKGNCHLSPVRRQPRNSMTGKTRSR